MQGLSQTSPPCHRLCCVWTQLPRPPPGPARAPHSPGRRLQGWAVTGPGSTPRAHSRRVRQPRARQPCGRQPRLQPRDGWGRSTEPTVVSAHPPSARHAQVRWTLATVPRAGVVITDPLPSGTLRHRGMGLAKIPQPFAGDRCPGHPPTRRPDRKRWTKGKSQDRKGTWGPDPGVRLDETSQRRLRPGPGRRALPPPKQRSPWKATRVTACRNAQAGRGRARWPQPTRGQRHVPGASARGSCLGTGTPACPLPPPPPPHPPPPAWEPP